MKKLFVTTLVIALSMSMVLSGCGKKETSKTENDSKTTERTDITVAQAGEPSSMDPHNCYESNSMRVYMNIFDGLTKTDEEGKIHPGLAEEWTISDDGLEYVFKLRSGVKFHNGEPLTANDVKFSIDRACASPYCVEAAAPIEKTEVVDERTVKVTLKYPYEPQIMFFASTYLSIVNEKAVTEKGTDYSIDPNGSGTGPYKFEKWDKGVAVTLSANEDYFEGAPAIKSVVYKNISEASAGDIAVESGDVDVYLHPSTVDVPHLEGSETVAVYEADSYYVEYFGFNMSKAPFDSKEVRQAIALSIDKEDVVMVAVDGIGGKVAGSIVAPLEYGHNEKLVPYPKDVEKAKELLSKGGYHGGFNCKITTVDGPRKKTAEALQASLKEIGVIAEIETLEQGAFFDAVMKGQSEIFVTGMTSLAADADPILYTCIGGDNVGITNYSFYKNPEVDALIMDSRKDTDAASRKEKLIKIQEIVYDEVPLVPCYFRKTINIANKELKGLVVEPNNFLRLSNLSWK